MNPREAVGFCVSVTGEAISDTGDATNINNYADDPYASVVGEYTMLQDIE